MTEIPLKAIITSQKPLTEEFPGLPCSTIDVAEWDWENTTHEMEKATSQLHKDRPELTGEHKLVRQDIKHL